jgi:hypothetical protein
MKFSRLIGKAEKIVDNHAQGHPVESAKLSKLQRLLGEKIARYQEKLDVTEDPQKREKLQTRLKVVNAQLQKSRQLSTR